MALELTNEFRVTVPIDRAWAVLTDVERIAPCMPGAQLEEIEGNEYRGTVKIKVGPISAQYKGAATFLDKDDARKVAKLRGEGRDSKGQGNASVVVTMSLVEDGPSATKVTIHNELAISGKVAQFARMNVVTEISNKILGQFVECLEHNVLATPDETIASVAAASATVAASAAVGGAAAAAVGETVSAAVGSVTESPATASAGSAASSASSLNGAGSADPVKPAVRKIEYKEAQPVDLLETAGSPILKRAAPAAVAVLVLLWLLRRFRK
jgi:uncharacterized protein